MITCQSCGKAKPDDEFGFRDKAHGIRQKRCRACFSEYNRARYEASREETKKRVYEYKASNPEKVLKTRLATCLKNPTHVNAYRVIEAAVKAGELEKSEKCQVCGVVPTTRIEAHHEDYSKPLEVTWCCPVCHDALDRERRRALGKPTHSRAVIVECVETGERFYSIADAARHEGVKSKALRDRTLNGGSVNGHHYSRVNQF